MSTQPPSIFGGQGAQPFPGGAQPPAGFAHQGAQPLPGSPGGQPPPGHTGAQPVSAPKKSRKPLIIGLAVALALALVGGIAAVVVATVSDRAAPTVVKMFEALQAGDADAAVALTQFDPANRGSAPLLTDEVLRRSNELAPIRDVEVIDSGQSETTVKYSIGERTEEVHYYADKSTGSWKIKDGVFAAGLGYVTAGGPFPDRAKLPTLSINGVMVDPTKEIWMLPGMYEFSGSQGRIDWKNITDNTPTTAFFNTVTERVSLTPEISEKGLADMTEAANKYLQDCAAKNELKPAGCPFSIEPPPGRQIEESTVKYSLKPEQVSKLQPTAFGKTQVTVAVTYTIGYSYSYTESGKPGTFSGDGELTSVLAANLDKTPVTVELQKGP